jgi:competence protein ComEC
VRLFSLAFVLAASWLQRQAALPEARWAAAGVAAWLGSMLLARWPWLRALALVAAGACLGVGLGAWRAEVRLADALPVAWEGRDIEVEGVVATLPQPGEKGTRFALDVESVRTPGATVPARIALTWFTEREKGAEEARAPPRLVAGQRWRLTVRLKRPRGLANPHTFDFEPWALERGLRATGYVRAKPAPELRDARVDGWPWTLNRWRGEIREAMTQQLGDARFRGVLVALVIGDQDAIAQDDWQVFWRTGVGHLMSISGLHITMLAGLAFAIAVLAWVRAPPLPLWLPARKAGVIAGVLVAIAYALLTGFAVPAQRTVLMLAVIAACVLMDRQGSPSRVLALAALAVTLADPWAVLSGGFWLSFGAVAAIFYVLTLRTGSAGRLRGAALEQLAVTVAMLPMMLALFQEVSLVSPLANAIAIPAVSLVIVPLALGGAFLGAGFLLEAAHQLMAWLMVPLEALAAFPGAVLESHEPAAWTVGTALVGCAWLLTPRGFPLRPLGSVWIAPLFLVVPATPAAGEAWIDVLDVGHGLAIVVRTATHALVYDTGPSWSAESDSGSRIVVPYLRGEGLRRLDGLVVSHADDDHAGGAWSIAQSRAPPWLLSPLAADDPLHAAFAYSRLCRAGQSWTWDGVRFEVLHPADAAHDEARRRENDRSCVLRVAAGTGTALLTGDIEQRSEAELLARDRAGVRADVLLVPHHGSKTSSTPPFLEAVAPQVALVSVGYRNRFRHPNEAVMLRYAARGIPVRRTDAEGALRIVLGASGARIERLAPPARYWSDRR